MIKIKVISVGKLKEKSLRELTSEYEKRLKRYVNIEFIELNDLPVSDNPSESQINEVLNKEAEEIIKKINPKFLPVQQSLQCVLKAKKQIRLIFLKSFLTPR